MSGLKESRFNMWRAVVAMMHADNVVRPHEVNFILENTKGLPLSEEQRQILTADIRTAQPIDNVFHKITSRSDKEDFFHLARAMAWADGDLSNTEADLLKHLEGLHLHNGDEGIMRLSLRSFEEIYLDKKGDDSSLDNHDKTIVGMIRQIVSRKAA